MPGGFKPLSGSIKEKFSEPSVETDFHHFVHIFPILFKEESIDFIGLCVNINISKLVRVHNSPCIVGIRKYGTMVRTVPVVRQDAVDLPLLHCSQAQVGR